MPLLDTLWAVLGFALAGFVLARALAYGLDIDGNGLKDSAVAVSAAAVCAVIGFALSIVMAGS